jgi:RHS repeat-associated protein
METVAPPPAPAGGRDVSVTREGQPVGDFSTLRDLSLSGQAGAVAVPPGTYGRFSAAGRTALVLGVENASEPAVYNLQGLTLNGGSELRLVGPVALTVRGDVSLTGSTVGAADNPRLFLLKVAEGGVKVGGGAVLYGVVRAPRGAVEIAGRGRVRGTVMCDRLTVGGNGVLQVTETDVPPPPVNRPPAVDAGPDMTTTLPADTVSLNGTAGDDGLPRGGTLSVNWSASSGPGPVSFGSPDRAATTATFVEPGIYVLKLTASDGQLIRSDSVQVEVVARNRPPVVEAGADQTIKFPNSAALAGTVADDALPRGSILSLNWSVSSGPGAVTFGQPHDAATTATFAAPGVYTLKLSADDSEFSSSDEVAVVVSSGASGRVYTLDADFDKGGSINVVHSAADQLQLDETARSFNFIWVAVSSKGTVVKIDTETGAVLGEYFTSPAGQPRNPSRTTVDHNGNVWASNRDGNSVLRVGLVENGQCVDRDGNGRIDTSTGYGDVRPWTNAGGADTNGGVSTAQDECVINYTKVNSSGTRHVSVTKDNDVWVSGTGGQRFDLLDGKTGLIKRSESSVGYGGYGGLIDKAGVIWSARPLLRWDTANPLTGPNGGNWRGYGHDSYGLCIDSKGNVWNTSFSPQIHKFAPDGTHLGTFNHGSSAAQGCVVDKNDDVWVAHSLYLSTVGHLKNTGAFVGNITVGSGPTGVAVDARGRVWATNHNSGDVSRIDPSLGPVGADGITPVGQVDFTTRYLGGNLYNYSDMTGSTLSGAPGQGTWSAVFDSEAAGAEWGRVGWTARVCGDGLLTVSVATGEDGTNFSQPVVVSNGDDPEVPAGRYARVSVRFERASGGESPVLYDLSIGTAGFELETPANAAPEVDAGPDQTLEGVTKTNLRGAACDDALPSNRRLALSWSKVSGPGAVTFARLNSPTTEVTFAVPGIYELKLTGGDSAFDSSDTLVVEVLPGNEPPAVNAGPDRAVTHPDAANLEGNVTDDGLPRGGTLLVTWSKVSGPGSVTFAAPNAASTTARFGAPGVYVLRLTASDTEFARHDEVTVTVGGENQPPAVNAGSDRTITLPNTATLDGAADDDGWPEGNALASSWSKVSGPGTVSFGNPNQAATTASFAEPGDYVLRLTASDSLLSASDEVGVTVNPAVPPPVVSIGGLPDGAEVTTRVNVTGTVSAGSNWRLEYSPGDGTGPAGWTTLASGNSPVTNGLLGLFDPTLLLNGTYALRLVATDAAAQTTAASVSLIVSGQQKIGVFSLSFNDLDVPVAGLPIQLNRTYDSRDKRVGDFGVGWTLGLKNVRVEKSGVLGADWEQTQSGGFLPTYCLVQRRPRFVTVTFPNDKVYRFRAAAAPQCSQLVPIQTAAVSFVPLPGTRGSLAALGENDTLVFGDAPGPAELRTFGNLELYNPTLFRFTSEDGTVFILDQYLGVRSLTDPNGNTLTVSAEGIIHSGGKSVLFARDSLGRITGITDPAGNVLTYSYDAAGDLVSFTDREAHTTSFTYDSAHGLLTMDDPRGAKPLRNEYDEGGRLVRQVDAFGKVVTFTHEPEQGREVIADRLGHVTIQEYDAAGNVTRVVDGRGGVTTRTFDPDHNVLTETNPAGETTTYTYDAAGNRLSVTDMLGLTTRYTYNERRQVLTVTDPQGRVTTNAYDPLGNLTSTRDPLGNTTTVAYDSRGLRTSVTDGLGHTTTYEHDQSGNVTKETDALGRSVAAAYDANNNRVSETRTRVRPGGAEQRLTTSYQYDREGRLVKVTHPDGSTTQAAFNGNGLQVASVDSLGLRTEHAYDEMGRLVRTTLPGGATEESAYDAEGRRTRRADAAGRSTDFAYNALGQLEKITYADGAAASTVYDAAGRVTAVTDARGNTARYAYDAGGRRTKVTDPLGNVTTFAYEPGGKLASMTDSRGMTTRYEYDARGAHTKTIYPDGTAAETTYDLLGRAVAKRDQAGNVTRFEYDALDRLTKVTDAMGGVTTFAYDESGWLTSQTDANNHTTRFEYDEGGRRTKRTLPAGMSESMAYDAAGNLISRTDFRGKTTTFAYDSLNRLLGRRPDASLNEAGVAFTYTATGRRATMTDATGTTTYQYDSRDRLTKKATPFGALLYTYDAVGNLTSLRASAADGVSVRYTYDVMNRLSEVVDERAARGTSSHDYDENGNLAGVSYPNGVRATYTYDSLNRLTGLSADGGSTLARYAYTLGAAGNRLSLTEHGGRTVNYTYDSLYRLTEEAVGGGPGAGVVAYTYDAAGNRLSRVSTVASVPSSASSYDANDRLDGDTYDANGNTTASGPHTYAYDSEDRLTVADGGAVVFAYDGDGNRVAKTAGGVTTHYLVDDLNPTGHPQVVQESVGGSVVRTYTYGHQLIGQRRLAGGVWVGSFYGYDGHGSVRYLTDEAGAVTDTYAYDAFGNLVERTGTTPNEYLYAGERLDAEVGLYYLRARYMNTDTGRFQSADTYEGEGSEPLTLHKYLYAGADPANKVDPSGEAYTLTSVMEATKQRMFLWSTYPKIVFAAEFAYGVALPFEVAGTMSFGLGSMIGVGTVAGMASKELPLVRRLFERSAGMDRARAGTLFEEWFGKAMGLVTSRLVVQEGAVVAGQIPKGSAVLDYLYHAVIIEIKLTSGALKRGQAKQLAKYARATGQSLAYIFFKKPSPEKVAQLQKWIDQAAPGLHVTISHLYP